MKLTLMTCRAWVTGTPSLEVQNQTVGGLAEHGAGELGFQAVVGRVRSGELLYCSFSPNVRSNHIVPQLYVFLLAGRVGDCRRAVRL